MYQVYKVEYTIMKNELTLHSDDNVTSFNANQTCGYNANEWALDRALDVSGCSDSGIHYSYSAGDNPQSIIYHDGSDVNAQMIRLGNGGFSSGSLDCLELGLASQDPGQGSSKLCSGGNSSSSSSRGEVPLLRLQERFFFCCFKRGNSSDLKEEEVLLLLQEELFSFFEKRNSSSS